VCPETFGETFGTDFMITYVFYDHFMTSPDTREDRRGARALSINLALQREAPNPNPSSSTLLWNPIKLITPRSHFYDPYRSLPPRIIPV